jgi:RNA polymerase sigma-70 factor (ECF subfamily)
MLSPAKTLIGEVSGNNPGGTGLLRGVEMEDSGPGPSLPPSLDELIGRHARLLHRLAVRMTAPDLAEDLVQETFLTAHRKLGQLRQAESARGWLVSILRSHARQHYRRRDAAGHVAELDPASLPAPLPEVDDRVDGERVRRLVDELPEPLREAVVLYYFSDLKYREIAEACECPIGTVMSRLARAKTWLRERLSE